jgi:hypothetical protein
MWYNLPTNFHTEGHFESVIPTFIFDASFVNADREVQRVRVSGVPIEKCQTPPGGRDPVAPAGTRRFGCELKMILNPVRRKRRSDLCCPQALHFSTRTRCTSRSAFTRQCPRLLTSRHSMFSSQNDQAQQRRGPRELHIWEILHAPAVCCSAWFGLPRLIVMRRHYRLSNLHTDSHLMHWQCFT